jgi:hypothetical protein
MENLNYNKDRRRFPRVFMDLPLEYQIMDTPNAHGGLVVNASETGLLIHSIKDMPIGAKLNIAVLFPKAFELTNFEVLVEIVWKDIHLDENWEGYKYGLKFIQIKEEDLQKLRQLLGDHAQSKLPSAASATLPFLMHISTSNRYLPKSSQSKDL